MPLYEYVCITCEERVEALRSMSRADDPIDCPRGHPDTRRALSVFATSGGASGPGPAGGFT